MTAKRIILAAGHGGGDAGAAAQGTTEANETIQITQRVVNYLNGWGFGEVLKVPDDLGLVASINWVNARYKSIANGLAIEIHKNSGGGTGNEVWYPSGGDATSRDQATKIANRMAETTGLRNRGIKDAATNRWGKLGWTDDTNTYALLIEAGFIDVDSNDDAADDRFAKGIALGIMDIFGVSVPASKVLATADEVRQAYLDILERPADPGAITTYANSKFTKDEVRADLQASDEKKRLEAGKVAFNLVSGNDVKGRTFVFIKDAELKNLPDGTRSATTGKVDFKVGEEINFADKLTYANSKGEERVFYRTAFWQGRNQFYGFEAGSLTEKVVVPPAPEPETPKPEEPTVPSRDDEQDVKINGIMDLLKVIGEAFVKFLELFKVKK